MSEDIKADIPVSAPAGEGEARAPRGADRGDQRRRRFPRKKLCYFRTCKADYVDFKDANLLRRFIAENGKILPRRVTGTSAKFQRLVCTAIKRARYMALLPHSGNHK